MQMPRSAIPRARTRSGRRPLRRAARPLRDRATGSGEACQRPSPAVPQRLERLAAVGDGVLLRLLHLGEGAAAAAVRGEDAVPPEAAFDRAATRRWCRRPPPLRPTSVDAVGGEGDAARRGADRFVEAARRDGRCRPARRWRAASARAGPGSRRGRRARARCPPPAPALEADGRPRPPCAGPPRSRLERLQLVEVESAVGEPAAEHRLGLPQLALVGGDEDQVRELHQPVARPADPSRRAPPGRPRSAAAQALAAGSRRRARSRRGGRPPRGWPRRSRSGRARRRTPRAGRRR